VRKVHRNITEAVQSQAERQQSSELHQAIIASATEGICACHDVPEFPYVRFTVWNDRMIEATGYTMEEINTSGWYQTVYPDPEIQARAKARMDRKRQGDNLNQEEWEITRKDGQKRQIIISIRIVPGGETGVNVLAVMNDITERKKAEEETRCRVNELAALNALGRQVSATLLFEQVSDTALKGMMNAVHPDLAFFFLRDGEKLILKSVESTKPGKWLEKIPEHRVSECLCGLAAREGKPIYSRNIFTDDRCTWEECKRAGFRSFAALPLLSGTEVIGIVGIASYGERDFQTQAEFLETLASQTAVALENARLFEQVKNELTDRKQAEEALRESEDRYRDLVEHSHDLLCTHDLEGKLLSVNPAVLRIGGYSKEELLGMNFGDFLAPEVRGLFGNYLAEIRAKGVASGVMLVQTKGGEKRWWEYHNTLRTEGLAAPIVRGMARDITERKQAEEDLKRSQRLLNETQRITKVGGWEYDVATCRVTWTDEVYNIYGVSKDYDPSNVEQDIQFYAPEDQKQMTEAFQRAIKKGDPYDLELEFVNAQGMRLWVRTIGQIERNGGEIVRVFGNIMDMTERRRAEEEMARVAHEWQIIFDASYDAIWILDKDQRVLRSNKTAERFFQRPYSEFIGKHCWEIVHGTSQPIPQCPIPRARDSLRRETRELQIGKGWFEVMVDPILDEGGQFIGAVHIVRDIAETKQAEEDLKESEERYRMAIENSNDGVAIVKGDLHLYVNQRFAEIFGYESPQEIIGKDYKITVHPDDIEMVKDLSLKRQKGEAVPSQYEFKGIRKDGKEIYLEVSSTKITYKGEPVALTYLRDVTERKKAEKEMLSLQEQLRHSQKIEAIGQLAGGVAHDFNNILTVIKGTCQLSLLDLDERDPMYGNLKEIERSAERAAGLTRQLLAFSRKQILEVQVLDLNQVIQRLDKMLHRIIGEDIGLVTFFAEELGRVKVDPGQMEQVIINLAVNARDAMPKGGKLTIETANVELDGEYAKRHIAVKPGPYVMLSISDTGVGMTPEVKERLFEPFFTTKEMGKGTGLGLSTVYGIVKQSGGNIWVYSEPGQGTTFKIYLPRVDEPLEERKEEVIREVPKGDETILVVEDEETVRKLAVRLLKRQGYKVLEAPDGGQAFILCEKYQGPIHLILSDVVMPGMSGRELVERLQKIHPEAKSLYMSGYTDNVILHHGILEKGFEFISKPFTRESLARKVREVLDS